MRVCKEYRRTCPLIQILHLTSILERVDELCGLKCGIHFHIIRDSCVIEVRDWIGVTFSLSNMVCACVFVMENRRGSSCAGSYS